MPLELLTVRKSAITIFALVATLLTPYTSNAASDVKIALVYDVGGRGDKSFDDAAAIGFDRAKKRYGLSNLSVRELVTVGTEFDRENRLEFLAKAGYNIIIAVGPSFVNSLSYIAGKFPDSQFAIVDDASIGQINVASLGFREDQGSFLAGVSAALNSKSGKIAYIGDAALHNNSDQDSFIAGAKYASPKVKVTSSQVTGLLSTEVANLSKAGNDVIYSTWSRNGDVLNAVLAQNKAKRVIKLIGLSPDQFFLKSKAASSILLGYVNKRYDTAVEDIVGITVAGRTLTEFIDPNAVVYGRMYSLENGGVDFVSLNSNSISVDKLDKARRAIIAKKIVTPK
jgi:basic membrane protein A and related proteins